MESAGSSCQTGRVAAAVSASALAASAAMAWAVRGRSARVFGSSVWRGPKTRRAVALTFDDGPASGTRRLLDRLAEWNVRATFFQCGVQVRRRPGLARAVAAAGHELGNHTDSHRNLVFCAAGRIYEELRRAQETIEDATGESPALFRAPYGARWFGLATAQERLGLLGVMWSTLGLDWKLNGAAVASRLLKGAGSGAIFCLHDGRGLELHAEISSTIDALERVVPALLHGGYQFCTVSELLCQTPSSNA